VVVAGEGVGDFVAVFQIQCGSRAVVGADFERDVSAAAFFGVGFTAREQNRTEAVTLRLFRDQDRVETANPTVLPPDHNSRTRNGVVVFNYIRCCVGAGNQVAELRAGELIIAEMRDFKLVQGVEVAEERLANADGVKHAYPHSRAR